MARTFIAQASQIFPSENYNDNFTSGSALQSTSGNIEDDLNALRTQVKQILWAGDAGAWYDGVGTRGVNAINANLDTLNSDFTTLSGSIATLHDDVNTLEVDVATLFGDISTINGEISTLNGEFVWASGSINTINNELVTIDGEINTINNALTTLSGSAHRTRYNAGVITSVNANTNITFPTNLDAQLGNYSNADFTSKVNVYLNGILLLPGVDGSNANDVYPGDSATSGDVKFPYHVRSGSQVVMEIYSALL
jgi:outer membrane murein-binding lipoprotein Lpp